MLPCYGIDSYICGVSPRCLFPHIAAPGHQTRNTSPPVMLRAHTAELTLKQQKHIIEDLGNNLFYLLAQFPHFISCLIVFVLISFSLIKNS